MPPKFVDPLNIHIETSPCPGRTVGFSAYGATCLGYLKSLGSMGFRVSKLAGLVRMENLFGGASWGLGPAGILQQSPNHLSLFALQGFKKLVACWA